jgi:ureidoglycolate hydrolase
MRLRAAFGGIPEGAMADLASNSARELPAPPISAAAFAPFGALIEPTPDGAPLPAVDRALDLSGGRPRFYIMALTNRGLGVSSLNRHSAATQVLASASGESWLLAVAPPDEAATAPDPEAIRAFTIPGGVGVLLTRGTWHAGPYFEPHAMSFFNLELDDTNEVDHFTCDLEASFGLTFTLRPGV